MKTLDSSSVLVTIVAERSIADGKATFLEYEAAGLEISTCEIIKIIIKLTSQQKQVGWKSLSRARSRWTEVSF